MTTTPFKERVAVLHESATAVPVGWNALPARATGVPIDWTGLSARTGISFALQLVVSVGRVAAVLLAVSVPYLSTTGPSVSGAFGVLAITAVWVWALRKAFVASHGMVGIGLTAAIGAFAGLVGVAALNPFLLGLTPEALAATSVGVFASAAVWEWGIRHTAAGRRRVLLVGSDDVSRELAEELARARGCRFELIARVGEAQRRFGAPIPRLGGTEELAGVVAAQQPDLVVLTDETTYGRAVERLLDVPSARFRVVGLAGFFEHALGRVPIERITPAWFMSTLHIHQAVYSRWMKRSFDIVVSGLVLILTAPLLLALGVLVARTPGPVIYRQTRLGEGGRRFTMLKLRTMVQDAEQPGRPRFASGDDARTIPGGRFLRRTHLDELPQLWNVLKGDMSLVGPRPERPAVVQDLELAVPFWSRRLLVKPGITGWAQVSCGYAADCEQMMRKLSYDLWYLRYRSFVVDIGICLRTVGQQMGALLRRPEESSSCAAKGSVRG